MTGYFSFIWGNRRFLGFGAMIAFCSSFGQTYFIAVFGPEIRAEFGLSHGEFGGLYAIGTGISAVCLVWAGRLIDRIELRRFSLGVVCCLIAACAFMAVVPAAPFLVLGLFMLRISGQGLMSHTAMTSMARYFDAERGRAVSVAMMGFPLGVAVFPLVAVTLIDAVGWRATWSVCALALSLSLSFGVFWLLRGHEQRHRSFLERAAGSYGGGGAAASGLRQWSRRDVLHDKRFYLLVMAVMAPSYITTGFFFHQGALAADKGWSATLMASAFVGYTVGSIAGALSMGPLIDRTGSLRLFPFYLAPLVLACALIAWLDGAWTAMVFTILLGLGSGGGQTLIGTIWPELYGALHLGAIRSMIASVNVIGSALSPVTMGWLIDAGIDMRTISIGCLFYALFAIAMIVLALSPMLAPQERQTP
jgi:MFS family permease